jgi:RNA polymerase sigma-B factor
VAVAVSACEPAAPESPEQRTLHDARLLLKYHREGDLAAREELTLRFLPLARQLAARYRNRSSTGTRAHKRSGSR